MTTSPDPNTAAALDGTHSAAEGPTTTAPATSGRSRAPLRVGFDLRAFQIGHQFRGIGAVGRAIVAELDARLDPDAAFVAFADPVDDAITELFTDLIPSARTRRMVDVSTSATTSTAISKIDKVRNVCDPAFETAVVRDADVLVQLDHLLGVPQAVPTVSVVFDQIPLQLGDRYPISYKPTFGGARRAGIPLPTAINKAAARWRHERQLDAALRRSAAIVAISEHTRNTTLDFARSRGIEGVADRIEVAHLGLATEAPDAAAAPDLMEQSLIDGYGLAETPFVFFMGGTDDRRRIQDLVAAFNRLRARGTELKLVLAGYDFANIAKVISPATRAAIIASSYNDDIHLLGYVGDAMRHWLYHHAAAYVFPSIAEGFGMPVLEANSLGCPVVAYENPAVAEVAGPNTLLVEPHWTDLTRGIAAVLDRSEDEATRAAEDGRAWAARFDWEPMGRAMTAAVHRAAGVT